MKIKKHIQIVRSNNKRLSSMSQVSCEAILSVLSQVYERVGVSTIDKVADLEGLKLLNPDLVFMGMMFVEETEGTNRRRIWLSDYLTTLQIPYTGSGRLAHQLERDKALAKQRVKLAGLMTSPHLVFSKNEPVIVPEIGLSFPLFVKPNDKGGGLGVDDNSVVSNVFELKDKVQSLIARFKTDVLVESYLPGREFSVAIIETLDSGALNMMPLELIAPINTKGDRVLSGAVKDADTETYTSVNDDLLRIQVNNLASGIFKALGARGYGRIDIRLDKHGRPNFLEANLLPSLIKDYGNFPKACKLNMNISYTDMLMRIVDLGFKRQENPTPRIVELKKVVLPAALD